MMQHVLTPFATQSSHLLCACYSLLDGADSAATSLAWHCSAAEQALLHCLQTWLAAPHKGMTSARVLCTLVGWPPHGTASALPPSTVHKNHCPLTQHETIKNATVYTCVIVMHRSQATLLQLWLPPPPRPRPPKTSLRPPSPCQQCSHLRALGLNHQQELGASRTLVHRGQWHIGWTQHTTDQQRIRVMGTE